MRKASILRKKNKFEIKMGPKQILMFLACLKLKKITLIPNDAYEKLNGII
jgi:hypothetical protein